jgi:hypothetical protein
MAVLLPIHRSVAYVENEDGYGIPGILGKGDTLVVGEV